MHKMSKRMASIVKGYEKGYCTKPLFTKLYVPPRTLSKKQLLVKPIIIGTKSEKVQKPGTKLPAAEVQNMINAKLSKRPFIATQEILRTRLTYGPDESPKKEKAIFYFCNY